MCLCVCVCVCVDLIVARKMERFKICLIIFQNFLQLLTTHSNRSKYVRLNYECTACNKAVLIHPKFDTKVLVSTCHKSNMLTLIDQQLAPNNTSCSCCLFRTYIDRYV